MLVGVGALLLNAAARRLARAKDSTGTTISVAPGIHVRRGVDEDGSAANDDAIANSAFIVGRNAIAVFDPGGSLEDGRRLRARIREISPLPIRHIILSHGHPDHVFGAGAFAADNAEIIGHARLANALIQRGEYYRSRLEAILGKGAAGAIVMPTTQVADRLQIDLGERPLQLVAHEVAHSDCDLSVFDVATDTLLTGDLLFVERIPAFDGNVKGWQRELTALKATRAARAVPGHGPVSVKWPQGARDIDRYLATMLSDTRSAVQRGVELSDAVAIVGQSERPRWKLFDDYQGRNVTQVFKEIEWE